MIYLATFLLILVAFTGMVLYINHLKYRMDIRTISGGSQNEPDGWFHQNMLKDLPAPVARYLKLVIPEGFPMIQSVHLSHKGRFRAGQDKNWINITGDQHFSLKTPGFIWRGKTSMFLAEDRYLENAGRLKVRLFSLIPVLSSRGPLIDEAELQRWMGEHFWFPTNLLNHDLFTWEALDDRSSQLTLNYRGHKLPVIVKFDEEGLISEISCIRHFSQDKFYPWTGIAGKYKLFHGMKIPTRISATWHTPDGDFTYVDFELTEINYFPDPANHFTEKKMQFELEDEIR